MFYLIIVVNKIMSLSLWVGTTVDMYALMILNWCVSGCSH